MKKLLLEILQNSPENTLCQSLLFNKVAGLFHRTPLVAASVFFQSILLVLTKFSFWQENWALAYHSMKEVGFLCSKTTEWLQVQST